MINVFEWFGILAVIANYKDHVDVKLRIVLFALITMVTQIDYGFDIAPVMFMGH